MSKLLDSFTFDPISKDGLVEIKHTFEGLKESTIETLYELASTNLKLIERLAYFQKKKHVI